MNATEHTAVYSQNQKPFNQKTKTTVHTQMLKDWRKSFNVVASFFPSVLIIASALCLAMIRSRSAAFSMREVRGSLGTMKNNRRPIMLVMRPSTKKI